ncbi:MAG TPA: crosslink repair DNA glycosylase YcaQ family protein [Gemmatimonadaceae bacterium]|nr:crosslink repair DNA glycosylase YcaQ family protein [Gemmatimonadaceae bacterium]
MKLRAWWFHRQGLDGSLRNATPAQVLERVGWARSVGGVGPYLTLFARARTTRDAADAAVAKLQLHELPSARGCTYVLPASDFALGLKVGEEAAAAPMKVAAKLGVTEKEIAKLERAVLDALDGGEALDPDAIRDATGKASRSLGEVGKKKGVTTTLPLALGRLQARGEMRRVPVNGRLDQQRYKYVRWNLSPFSGAAYTELARRFFGWVGPATLGEFQWFSALGVKAAKEAVAPLDLVAAEGVAERLLLPADAKAWSAFEAPEQPCYSLVSSLDSIAAARREIGSLLDPKDAKRSVFTEASDRAGSAR